MRARNAIAVILALASGATHAQISACRSIVDAAARLACYDELAPPASASRSAVPTGVSGASGAPGASAASPAPAAPTQSSLPRGGEPRRSDAAPMVPLEATALEQRWELRPDLKRGIFNLLPYKPVYGLVHWTSSSNDQPSSPTRAFNAAQQIELNRAEGKFQMSFKTKAVEGLLGTPGDLWVAYTQVSYWQLGNTKYSSPFRETNYEPEATYLYPLQVGAGALRMRFAGLTLNHQSNGRAGSLSRSWNRIIGEAAAEYGPWSFQVRPWARIFASDGTRNDNPDIQDFTGRGELIVTRRVGAQVLTLTARHSLRSGERSRGSGQLDWAFPLAGAMNGHVQVFSGYGLNLIDYNHRQTTLGIGVSFFD